MDRLVKAGHDVVLVRHGRTEWSATGRRTGRTDVPLTAFGLRQADALAGMLGGAEFAEVLSSPLSRAWDTMERAGFASRAIALDDLVEWDYGVYEARRTPDIRNECPGWSVWSHEIIGGESVEKVGQRADRVIERIEAADGPVVVFAHGHLLRVFTARWLRMPAGVGRPLGLDTATLSMLGRERENRVIRTWNEACHLRSMDPPL
jgi:probable phosphoglycerate mutase